MAYAALISLAQLLEQILHQDRFFRIYSSDEEQKLKSLQEKVTFLLAFLDDQSHRVGDTLQSLEVLITDAVYQAQDMIETYILDQIRSDYESCGVNRGVRLLVSTIQKAVGRRIRNMYEEDLARAVEKIDFVVKEVMNIPKSCKVEDMEITHTSTSSATNGGTEMVGFDEDLIEIKERLCGESSRLRIIPIVGMGGIGKTTLARNVFDDSLIAYHFHTRAWITVSQEYHIREMLLALIDSSTICIEDSSKITNEKLMERAYKCLKGRTYLIIMDDMWSTNAWDDLRRIFSDDNNGSRIVITTRLTNVAEYVSSSPIHQMHFLNENQSWNLLRKNVFVEQSCPPELEEIGKIIAKNCGGLPLAIVVVAGILIKIDRTWYHWNYIAENIRSYMANSDEHYSNILTLSYNHLPNHLKACFLYMGFFSRRL